VGCGFPQGGFRGCIFSLHFLSFASPLLSYARRYMHVTILVSVMCRVRNFLIAFSPLDCTQAVALGTRGSLSRHVPDRLKAIVSNVHSPLARFANELDARTLISPLLFHHDTPWSHPRLFCCDLRGWRLSSLRLLFRWPDIFNKSSILLD